MQHEKISLDDASNFFSRFFLDYIHRAPQLAPFYHRTPQLASFSEQLQEKASSFSLAARQRLVGALREQYNGLEADASVIARIESLKDPSTFTVTTGHQLNLLTGPLYVIYKIASVINLTRQLQKSYPAYNFLPVYWMASEDHDIDEIRSVRIHGKTYSWDQPKLGGAVGDLDPRSLEALLKEIPSPLFFQKAYLKHARLSDAVRDYMNTLFGHEGLVIVDGNHPSLKGALTNLAHDDLFEHIPQQWVEQQNEALIKEGYTPQIHVRSINFFHLAPGSRSLIQSTQDGFTSHEGKTKWSHAEMQTLITETPEQLSPNVVLRPLYQELILPNLAYIGGPAEIIYWLQLGQLFAHYQVPFPILVPRGFALVMDGPTARTWDKTGLTSSELFKDIHELHNRWVSWHATEDLTVEKELATVKALFEQLSQRVGHIDPTLIASVKAEEKKLINRLSRIEKKILRAERRKHADSLRQISTVKDNLFPGGILQERVDNFLNFYSQDHEFIKKMISTCNPLDLCLNLVRYPYTG